MIIHRITCETRAFSKYPDTNWLGGDWQVVPQELETLALELAPYCIIHYNERGEIIGFTDDGTRPPPVEPEPSKSQGDIAQLTADVAEALAAIDAFLEEIAPESSQIIAIEKDTMGASLEGVRING